MKKIIPVYIVFSLVVLVACGDPVLRARRSITQNPKKAVELLKEAIKDRKNCNECKVYLAMAYEQLGDLKSAEQTLQPVAKANDPRFSDAAMAELYKLYKTNFVKAASDQQRLAIALKAAVLENKMKIAGGFAGEFLLHYYAVQFKHNLKQGHVKKAVTWLKKAIKTFASPDHKKEVVRNADSMLKTYFIDAFKARLPLIQTTLLKAGRFDARTGKVVLFNRFVVPSKAKDPAFDPASKDFELRVRLAACKPLRQQLDTVVKAFVSVSPVKMKKIGPKQRDQLFSLLFPLASAGYDVPHAKAIKNKAGLPYICFIRIKAVDFLNYLYAFWKF